MKSDIRPLARFLSLSGRRKSFAGLLAGMLLILGFFLHSTASPGKVHTAGTLTWNINPSSNHNIANSGTPDVIEVTLYDGGVPLNNVTVNFTLAGTVGVTYPVKTDNTGVPGDAVFNLSGTQVGSVVVTITYNGQVLGTETLYFDPGPAVATPPAGIDGTILTVTQDGVAADGTSVDIVTAHITDQYGNPVAAGTPVTFYLTPGGTIATGTAQLQGNVQTVTLVTDASGNIDAAIHSTQIGTQNVSASILVGGIPTDINGSPQTVNFVTSTPVPVTPPGINGTILTTVLDGSVADGTQVDIVNAYITDANGNPVGAGVPVTFYITTGGTITAGIPQLQGNVQTITLPTDATGHISASISSTMAGTVNINASILFGGVQTDISGSSQTVNFVHGPPVPVTAPGINGTILTVTQDGVAADGTSVDSVKAHITDANGNPVGAGVPVTFYLTPGGSITPGTAQMQGNAQTVTLLTDASGNIEAAIHSTLIGTQNVNASIVFGGVPTDINGSSQTVNFVTSTPVSVTPPGVNGTILTTVQDGSVADGTQVDIVNAYITDANGNHVGAGVQVTFYITTGGTITAGIPQLQGNVQTITLLTDATGNVSASITSTKAGTVNINASILVGAAQSDISGSSQTVTFVHGAPVAVPPAGVDGTILTVTQNGVTADGLQVDSVNAHITDANGNQVGAGVPVTFYITTGGTITAGIPQLQTNVQTITLLTDASGNIEAAISSTMSGTVDVGATIVVGGPGGVATPIYKSPQAVTFVAGTPVPVAPGVPNSTILTVTQNDVPADGAQVDSVQAHITDINGNPVAGVPVTFYITTGGTVTAGKAQLQTNVQTITLLTDASGNIEAAISSTMSGTVNVGASILFGGVTTDINGSAQTVTFTTFPDVTNPATQLIVVVYEALADGTGMTVVKAHVVDEDGVPMNLQEVTFSIDSGTAKIVTAQPVMTDANGDAIIDLVSNTPGDVLVTATVGGKQITFGSPARVKFVPVNIYVPRVFTPNGDGTNDVLRPILVGISTFHYLSIYNRWGNLIFTTQDPNAGWDGTFKGVAQPVETYLWIAEGVTTAGKTVVQKGMVSLVR